MSAEREDRARWDARYEADLQLERAPSRWVLEVLEERGRGVLLDVACGAGRHARVLAAGGWRVVGVDFSEPAVRAMVGAAPAVMGVVGSVRELPFADGCVDAVLVTNFLERALFGELVRPLRPGGVMVYETYTEDHAAVVEAGRARAPRNPAYLLRRGELPRLVEPWLAVERYREELVVDGAGERHVGRLVAVRRSGQG